MYYAVYDGKWNSYNQEYSIISVHKTLEGALKKLEEIKQQTAHRITNPHYFMVRKFELED